MFSEWAYYESFFSAEECDSILEKAKSLPLSEGTVTEELKVNHKIRRSEVSFINRRNSDFASVFSQLDYCVNEANDKWFGVDYNPTGAHYMQFTVYRGGQEGGENQFYGSHQDTGLVSKNSLTQRKLSIIVQLSNPEDYEGGNFVMDQVDSAPPADMIRKRGSVIIFPALVYHQVTPVTKGTRCSLVSWYLGPPWR